RRYAEAIEYLRQAYELAPRGATATLLAHALRQAGRAEQALRTLAVDRVDDAPAIDARGAAQAASGDIAGAWRRFGEAYELMIAVADTPPQRIDGLARRLATIAERQAESDPASLTSFLAGDARLAQAFVSASMSRLAFRAPLRDRILLAGCCPA